MTNFCTLFDSNYLTRGLALHESLLNNCSEFHLYIFAFDNICLKILKKLNLPSTTVISLKEFEDKQLLDVKPSRSIAEYCWTSTSSTVLYVLNNFNVESCTYIDADLYFYSSPQSLIDEMNDKSILLTEHRYSPQYNKELKSGKYCVQFVTFKKNSDGLTALNWWRERCLEWCYARYEDGKFGDQLYLDDWTERFKGVHELQNLGGGLAAWNIQQYTFVKKDNRLIGYYPPKKIEFEAVFYHFHYLRFISGNRIELGRRYLSREVIDIFYKPYIKRLIHFTEIVKNIDSSFDPNGTRRFDFSLKTFILYIYRKINSVYNIYSLEKLIK